MRDQRRHDHIRQANKKESDDLVLRSLILAQFETANQQKAQKRRKDCELKLALGIFGFNKRARRECVRNFDRLFCLRRASFVRCPVKAGDA